jgi:hypothetical protein
MWQSFSHFAMEYSLRLEQPHVEGIAFTVTITSPSNDAVNAQTAPHLRELEGGPGGPNVPKVSSWTLKTVIPPESSRKWRLPLQNTPPCLIFLQGRWHGGGAAVAAGLQ